jgi:hypothetical protein
VSVYLDALKAHKRLGVDMYKDIAAYSIHGGYVFIAPEYLMWCKPVERDKPISGQWHPDNPDAWYIRFACGLGSISRFIPMLPYHLPYTGWARALKGKPLTYYKTDNLKRF